MLPHCVSRTRTPSGSGNDEIGALSTSPASFRARLEFLAAELAALGMLSEPSSGGGGESGDDGQKLDTRRTDALKLADRVEALKRVERSLLNCKRLGDPELLQVGIVPSHNEKSTQFIRFSFVLQSVLRPRYNQIEMTETSAC